MKKNSSGMTTRKKKRSSSGMKTRKKKNRIPFLKVDRRDGGGVQGRGGGLVPSWSCGGGGGREKGVLSEIPVREVEVEDEGHT